MAQDETTIEWARGQQRLYSISEATYQAWRAHKHGATKRGIPFHFSLFRWHLWWRGELHRLGASGVRGRRRDQYVMARIGDAGAYELGNVKCITAGENLAEADPVKRSDGLRTSWAMRHAVGINSHLKQRGDGHPRSRAVITPTGRYGSAALAGEAHGISRQGAAAKAREGRDGWAYE